MYVIKKMRVSLKKMLEENPSMIFTTKKKEPTKMFVIKKLTMALSAFLVEEILPKRVV